MHELAVCHALMRQVDAVARRHGAGRVERIVLSIGPLSGVEAPLLERAYTVARCGTRAEDAELEIVASAVRVRCRAHGHEGEAEPNRLLCPECGDWQVDVVAGDEMLLLSVVLADLPDEDVPSPRQTKRAAATAPEA